MNIFKKSVLFLALLSVAQLFATKIDGRVNTRMLCHRIDLCKIENGNKVIIQSANYDKEKRFSFDIDLKPGVYILDYYTNLFEVTKTVHTYKKTKPLQDVRFFADKNQTIHFEINPEAAYTITGNAIEKSEDFIKMNQIYTEFDEKARKLSAAEFETFFTQNATKSVQDFLKKTSSKDKKQQALLKAYLENDLKYTYLVSCFMNKMKTVETTQKLFPKGFFAQDELLELGNLMPIIDIYSLNFFNLPKMTTESLIDFILPNIPNPKIKEAVLMRTFLADYTTSDEWASLFQKYKPLIVSAKAKSDLNDRKKVVTKDIGQKAVPFSYKDIDGKVVSLSDFKGKIVYIDLWATWCGPCLAEIPHMKKLYEEINHPDLVFLGLSTDKLADKPKWVDMVKKKNLPWQQLYVDNNDDPNGIIKQYEVNTIPRFLLIDKEGNQVSIDARRPSDPELKTQLVELLKK